MNRAWISSVVRSGVIGITALIVVHADAAAQYNCSDWTESCASVEIGHEDGEIQVMVPIWWPYKPIVTFEPEAPASPPLPWEPVGGRDVCDRAIPAPECDLQPGAGGQGTAPQTEPTEPTSSEPSDEITPGDITPVEPPAAPPLSSVPEPISTTLVAVGLAGYGLARKRRGSRIENEEPDTEL